MKALSRKSFLVSAALGLTLIAHAQPAISELLRWNLQNVLFNDGGTASGFFSLDPTQTSGPLADFDIKVTGGKYPSFEYTPREGIAGFWGPVGGNFGPPASVGAAFATTSGLLRVLQLAPVATQGGAYPLKALNDPSYDPYIMSFEQLGQLPNPDLAPRWVRTGLLTTGTPQPPGHGTLVKWTLDGVKFDEGGTATGSFIYDASTGTVLDFSFHFEGALNGFPYGDVNQSYPCQPNNIQVDNGGGLCWVAGGLSFRNGSTSPAGSAFVRLVPEKPLTEEGGIVPLSPGFVHGYLLESGSGVGWSYGEIPSGVVGGTLRGAVIPEPAEGLLLALGLGALLGYSTWRRHKRIRMPRPGRLRKRGGDPGAWVAFGAAG